jgi:pyruvate/2-oxoglutarate dehydrogenase complex dihydrolipoamide acyltransferase (E2) component
MTEIRIPRINQSATEAVLIDWKAEAGTKVKAGDVIALIETDKSEIEIESPTEGTFQPAAKIQPGATYEIGTVLAYIQEAGTPVRPEAGGPRIPPATTVYASPKARQQAKDRGIDLATVTGSGKDGLIVAADLGGASNDLWEGRKVRKRHKLDAARKRVARATTDAWTVPHFVQMIDVDVTNLAARRKTWRGVTWTALFVAALARALAQHQDLNAAVDGDHLVAFDTVNIGVAVDTDRGLLVPVVADADTRPLKNLAAAVRRATDDHAGDPVGASATVSNLGRFGIRAGTPVLHSPEPVLLFTGAVEERAKVVEGHIAIRTMVTLSFAFDHRVTDGAPAARFVGTVRDILEHPEKHL